MELAEVERLAEEVLVARQAHERSQEVTTQLFHTWKELENKLMQVLKEHGKQKYISNVGTYSIISTEKVTTPKTDEDKALLFDWLKEEGLFLRAASVNYQTLQSLYNEAREKYLADGGDPLLFQLPGVGQATVQETVRFRKKD